MNELLRALAVLAEPPAEGTAEVARALGVEPPTAAVYTDLFAFQLYPYASVYLGADGAIGGDPRARVADFWRLVGAEPPAEPDHLASLLALAASLLRPGTAAGTLVHEFLLPWLPAWSRRVQEVGRAPYDRWARLLEEALGALAIDLPPGLPVAFREAPAPFALDDHDTLDELVGRLLVPLASGAIIVRDDLRRAGVDLDLGVRAGERRFALRSLLGQDPAGVLGWLAEECRRQADGNPTTFLADRARTTARCLEVAALAVLTRA